MIRYSVILAWMMNIYRANKPIKVVSFYALGPKEEEALDSPSPWLLQHC
jgi:hypothetical protein